MHHRGIRHKKARGNFNLQGSEAMGYHRAAGQKGEDKVKRLLLCCLPVLALFVLLSAAPAFAGSAAANITVQASVNTNCTIGAGSLLFGTYDPAVANETSPLDAQGSFNIRCTRGTAATIDLGPGANYSGTTRRMSGGGAFLAYELYRDAGRTSTWGTGAGNNLNPYQGEPGNVAPNSGTRSVSVYGRVPAGQIDAISGPYTDTVVATINF